MLPKDKLQALADGLELLSSILKECVKQYDLLDTLDTLAERGEYVSKSTAARIIGVSPSYIRARILDGSLTEYKTGISTKELIAFESSGRRKASKPQYYIPPKPQRRQKRAKGGAAYGLAQDANPPV